MNRFDLVITLCGDAKDKCPALDYGIKHVHWDLRDPAKFNGTELEIASHFRNTRTLILKKINKLKIKLERGSLK